MTDVQERDKWRSLFQIYRDEVRHKGNLITSRLSALMSSQAFLVIPAERLYERQSYNEFLVVAIPAFMFNVRASIALNIGCMVLSGWQLHGENLKAGAQNALDDYKKDLANFFYRGENIPIAGTRLVLIFLLCPTFNFRYRMASRYLACFGQRYALSFSHNDSLRRLDILIDIDLATSERFAYSAAS